jgi:hypothetical protein
MQGTLVLAILAVRSSYGQQIEVRLGDSKDIPDTLQWWITASGTWRIRTYAIDHDIHTHQVDGKPDDLLVLASEGNRKHYDDVLGAEHVLQFSDCNDRSEVQAKFRAVGLEPRLEIAAGRFAFWKPDDLRYSTKTAPG